MNYFYSSTDSDGNTYSLDMVRITYSFYYGLGQYILNKFSSCLCFVINHWESFKIGSYRYTFQFLLDNGCSFVVGIGHNLQKLYPDKGYIEFNPNKVGKSYELDFCLSLLNNNSKMICLSRYDLAIDIHCSRNSVVLDRTGGRKYQRICKSKENVTEYLGQRSSAGFVKIYNKQIESNLGSPLTRLELTLDSFIFSDALQHFP